jgi:hypothetical protein
MKNAAGVNLTDDSIIVVPHTSYFKNLLFVLDRKVKKNLIFLGPVL